MLDACLTFIVSCRITAASCPHVQQRQMMVISVSHFHGCFLASEERKKRSRPCKYHNEYHSTNIQTVMDVFPIRNWYRFD